MILNRFYLVKSFASICQSVIDSVKPTGATCWSFSGVNDLWCLGYPTSAFFFQNALFTFQMYSITMKMCFVQIIKFICIVIMILEWIKCNNLTNKATFALSFHMIVFIHYFLSILSWMSSPVSPFSVSEVRQILSSSLYFKNLDLWGKAWEEISAREDF